jgi:O-antigen/teichoic acid export membrane protein
MNSPQTNSIIHPRRDVTAFDGVSTEPDLSERTGVKTSFWDYLSLLSSNLICLPLQILLVALTTRLLGPEGYGHIALYNMAVGLGLMITFNWTAGSVLRFGREEFEIQGRINHTFWARTTIIAPCLVFWLAIVLLLKDILSQYIGMPPWAVGLLTGSVFLGAANSYLISILQAIRRMQAYAAVQIIGSATAIAGLILIFFKLFPADFLTVIILGVVSLMITVIIACVFWVPRNVLLPIEIDRKTLRGIFQFSYPVILASISGYIVNWVDVMAIKQFLTVSDVGGYQVAYQTFLFGLSLIMVVSTLTTPILISFLTNDREDLLLRYSTRLAPQGFLVWSVAVGIGLAISPIAFRLVFGNRFVISTFYFQFLALGLALNVVPVFCNGIMMAYKMIKYGVAINIFMAFLNLLGDFLLIPILGAVGAAISTSIAIGASAFLNLFICQRRLKIDLCWQLTLVLPAFLSLGVSCLVPGQWAPFLAIGTTLVAGYYMVKTFHIFQHEDLLFLNYIKMPVSLKRAIVWVYPFLVSEKQYHGREVNS